MRPRARGLAAAALVERLRVMPAVVVTGARQAAKSTLVQRLVPGNRRYASLDDLDVLDTARRDPEALIGGKGPMTLDEVQREPDLLRDVKRAIDRDRKPGRFLLTGSANLLLMRQVSESLAGRSTSSSKPAVACCRSRSRPARDRGSRTPSTSAPSAPSTAGRHAPAAAPHRRRARMAHTRRARGPVVEGAVNEGLRAASSRHRPCTATH
jgi:hypothetical protein